MASSLFPTARDQLVAGTLDWTAGVIRAVMLPEGAVFDYTTEYLEDIPAGQRIAVSADIESRAINDGWYGGRPVAFGVVFDTRKIAQVVFFLDTGDEATSLLIARLDDEGIFGEPFVPAGVEYFMYPDAYRGGFFFLSNVTAPTLTVLQSEPGAALSLSWTVPASTPTLPVLGYELYRSVDGGPFALVTSTTAVGFTDTTQFEEGVEVAYYVDARLNVVGVGDPAEVLLAPSEAETITYQGVPGLWLLESGEFFFALESGDRFQLEA